MISSVLTAETPRLLALTLAIVFGCDAAPSGRIQRKAMG
jgi:hypothetical protein